MNKQKLRQLFKNRSNCYVDTDDVVQGMDENCFIETVNEALRLHDVIKNELGSPFTEQEAKIMQLIVDAHNEFVKLDRGHSMEIQEWVSGIHQLQSILSHRCLRRLFPSHFA
jgi:hypothetical protein